MSDSTHVFIVCSPRPRTGKTLAARLIAEFYQASARPVSAFDLEPFEPGLAEHLPQIARHVSLSDTRGQKALFDRLIDDDGEVKVVDLGHLALEKFFTMASDIDFGVKARKKKISTMIMYVADQTSIALNTYTVLRKKFPEFGFIPVHNDAVAHGIELRRHFPTLTNGMGPLHIPQMSANLRAAVDHKPFSFVDAHRSAPGELAQSLRDELERFMQRTFRNVRETELALLMRSISSKLAIDLEHAETESVPLEGDQRADGDVHLAQLVGAAELGQINDKAGGQHVGAHLAQ